MLVGEMHEQFLHFYDKQSNFTSPEVTAEEIDIYLNYAQEQFLKILTEKGLEKSQEWVDYTRNIVTHYLTNTFQTPATKPNGVYVQLPADYRIALLEEADITVIPSLRTCDGDTTFRVPVVPISRDEYSKAVKNPFKKPWREEILRTTASVMTSTYPVFELIAAPGITINTYYIDYLRQPIKIRNGPAYSTPVAIQHCELEAKAASKIIEMAVSFALQTIGDPRINLEQYDKLIKTI